MNRMTSPQQAQSHPEKHDEIQEKIFLILQECKDADPNEIAVLLHDCNYSVEEVISRINNDDIQNNDWKTIKPNYKKKNSNYSMHTNSSRAMDVEQNSSLPPQRAPRRPRVDQYSTNSSKNVQEEKQLKNPSTVKNQRNSMMNNQSVGENLPTKTVLNNENEKQTNDVDDQTRTSTVSACSNSSIPNEPVIMYRTVPMATAQVDIQFGDIQWKNSQLVLDNSPNQTLEIKSENSILESPMEKIDSESIQKIEEPKSDEISTTQNSENPSNSTVSSLLSTENRSGQIPINYSMANRNLDPSLSTMTSFQQFDNYQSGTMDYSQGAATWSTQTNIPTPTTKSSIIPQGPFPRQNLYPITAQPYFYPNYGYTTNSSPMYSVFVPQDLYGSGTYQSQTDSYSYPTNYSSPYTNSPQYSTSTTDYDHQNYETDYYAPYSKSLNTHSDHVQSSSTQNAKDNSRSSRLSATAASFNQPSTMSYMNAFSYQFGPHFPTYDTRDNRHGASQLGNIHRSYNQQRQRSGQNHSTNSNWHS